MEQQKIRYYLIDSIRGIAVINMVIYHFLYDVFIVYGYSPDWADKQLAYVWSQTISMTFILVAGISWHWGKKNLKRGIFVNVWGGVITVVTVIAVPSEAIWFGILSLLGCSILLMIPLDRVVKKRNPYAGIGICLLCFAFFRNPPKNVFGWELAGILSLPQWMDDLKLSAALGMPPPDFVSSDYFPIFPWFFLFCAGYFLWFLVERSERCKELCRYDIPVLSSVGRKSIWIYLVHQPICILICYLLFGESA